ncbi:MAG: prepilin-type N-terminal cleavage/methylation domain-containing protein [Verrucomicrobiota bacterium]
MKRGQTLDCDRRRKVHSGGYSLVEIVIVVVIIGILTAAALSAYRGVTEGTRRGVAQGRVDRLNGAVAKYSQVSWEFSVAADDESGNDEVLVLRSLQWRDPVDPVHGSPFFENDWDPAITNSEDAYRIRWNGFGYDLLVPGETGKGLEVRFDGADSAQTVDFGEAYQPVGPA